jgi:DNA adenine methylase
MTAKFPKAFYWPGAKWWMRDILHRFLPAEFESIRISFGGRLDFLTILRMYGFEGHAFCSDLNPRVIEAHTGMRDNPDGVIAELEIHRSKHSYEYYIEIRNRYLQSQPIAIKAADFVYLSRTTYKGILKQTREGVLTTCSARDKFVFDPAVIHAHSRTLRNTTLNSEDFAVTMMSANTGEFIVADPPYLDCGVHGTMSFNAADQIRLAHACRVLHRRGINFLVTNSDEPFIRQLFRSFVITPIVAPRVLGWSRNGGKETELIITNY